eukprot:TRINITY_DN828_c0_g1_i2.p1 TRINITY_DN828_c0_g1~~TRINITY_DN828_c0_g1_i2.p1  ORF type:complete len:303 (+),score=60.48 TRINITY_DN828_c0_g1_i2:351-1259(+)
MSQTQIVQVSNAGTETIPANNTAYQNDNQYISRLEWNGLKPQKYHGGKIHLRAQDQLGVTLEGQSCFNGTRKHFNNKTSDTYDWKPSLKQYDGQTTKETGEPTNLTGCKHIQFKPMNKKDRPQKFHLRDKISTHLEDFPEGLKTFEVSNKQTINSYNLENQMGLKVRVSNLQKQRNQLPVLSLGDKPYRHPDYSSNFFKEGGIIPSANMEAKKKKVIVEKQLKSVRVPGKLTWKERVVKEEKQFDEEGMKDLESWTKNMKKEANPNYKDSDIEEDDKVPDNSQQKQQPNQGKDSKKAAKKGK